MTLYNVHLFREMRLFFSGIEASSADEAARIAADRPTDEAEYTDDWDGENRAALVDVVGDEDFAQSVIIDLSHKPQTNDEAAIDIQELLVERRQIAVIWSVDDVQFVRPDLDVDQSWLVPKKCERDHDAGQGITWALIESVADDLFSCSDDGESQ